MMINSIGSYVQPILSSAVQSALGSNPSSSKASNADSLMSVLQKDDSQLSPLANLLSTLQQLQQSDPTKYQDVTNQIATNLKGAADKATAAGDTAAAAKLNQLATDFSNASKTGQLPDIKDLAQTVSGRHGHHHGHRAHAASGSSQTDANKNQDPLSIIMQTLTDAGVTNGDSNSLVSTDSSVQS